MNIDKKDIDIYLSEIAERLWSGHASLMVGAGFSKNATKVEATVKKFPDLNDLGDCFYEKINGQKPTEKEKSYLDVLKLANEVEATFGRPTLNKILRDEIPNMEYQPSQLHKMLLQLPWVDVFTTNYDSLLERAAEKILDQRYETVVNKEDLIWSTKPRIIKLHGSFPSERPFIITEEDYRKYPTEYAPFVNTVQQSLLENTLCLIGFSGDDPNFQKWIGWIRDNLGKENSPKIFLIGILSLSIGQKKLLEDRNIVPIDLSCYSEKEHSVALKNFVEKINEYGKNDNKLDWGYNDYAIHHKTETDDVNDKLNKIVECWKQTRESYPNWIILPKDNRDKLLDQTDDRYFYDIGKIKTPLDIEFLYEFNWRQEKCLIPIYNERIGIYEKIINKYDPSSKEIQGENVTKPDSKNITINWDIISKYWIELQLSLLRFYREEGFNEKWDSLSEKLEKIKNKLSPELISRYGYERCLRYLFLLDISSVRKELTKWVSEPSLPYWEAKKAGLMAELGDTEEAVKILEISLNEVRNRLHLSPVTNDYALVSQEAYLLQLLRYVKQSLTIKQQKYDFEETKDFSERWYKLIAYKCDPWGELKLFDASLKTEPPLNSVQKKYGFEIGKIINTHHSGKDYNTIGSYTFLRYVEEVGIPLNLSNIAFGKEPAQKAITYIAKFSPHWSFASLIRSGNTKIVDTIFGRRALSFMSQKNCDAMVNNYLDVLTKSASEIEKGNAWNNNTFAISLSTVIPEILSRLCVKCSHDTKYKILLFLKELYYTDYKNQLKYTGVKKLVEILIKSFSNEEQYDLLPLLLDFPILDKDKRDEYLDPFLFLNEHKPVNENSNVINVNKITELLNLATSSNSKRKLALRRLYALWSYDILNKEQVDDFGRVLWEQTDSFGFPAETDFYYHAFLILPYPKSVNPYQLLQDYFKKSELPVQGDKSEMGISIGDKNYLLYSILGTTNEDCDYSWAKDDINLLLSRIIAWWNSDKEYLKQTDIIFIGSISDEFKSRFKKMIQIFSNLIESNIELLDPINIPQIEKLLSELAKYGMPDLEAKAAFFSIFSNNKQFVHDEICHKLCSKKETDILDAVNAISVLTKNRCDDVSALIETVSENIKNRTEIGLHIFLGGLWQILKYNPQNITDKILENISIGMKYLVNEVIISENDSDEIIHKKLLIKRSTANLLAFLKKFIFEEKKENIPHYILDWEKKCLDVDEFAEIRNAWLNSLV